MAVYSTDKALGHQCEMFIIDTRNVDSMSSEGSAIIRIPINGPRISSILWGALDETIITGHEDGEINIWDVSVRILTLFTRNNLLEITVLIYNFIYRLERN